MTRVDVPLCRNDTLPVFRHTERQRHRRRTASRLSGAKRKDGRGREGDRREGIEEREGRGRKERLAVTGRAMTARDNLRKCVRSCTRPCCRPA